ncbi:MAG: hypothetical protein PVG66_04145 [Chromatiales bacterium]|jgi:hypothetical protein
MRPGFGAKSFFIIVAIVLVALLAFWQFGSTVRQQTGAMVEELARESTAVEPAIDGRPPDLPDEEAVVVAAPEPVAETAAPTPAKPAPVSKNVGKTVSTVKVKPTTASVGTGTITHNNNASVLDKIKNFPGNVVKKIKKATTKKAAKKTNHKAAGKTPDAAAAPAPTEPKSFDEYKVVLGADEHMQIPGLPGEMRVWIGATDASPELPEDMVQDETTVPAVGESAEVEADAPGFTVEPAERQCIKIHPSGSEVRFRLKPKDSGTFEVGANVYLFDSDDCSGPPVPKTVAALKVEVEVDEKAFVIDKIKQLWNVFWEQFLEFWGAFVALLFGLVLFLIRGKLKRWFGFENE